jgi:hypothetical protein
MTQRAWRDRGQLPDDMALGQRWGTIRICGYEHHERYSLVLGVCL